MFPSHDTLVGGNFRAYTDSFIILPNQEKSIPLKFIGTYLSDVTSHVYTLTLNGVSNAFTLTITIPVENNPPIISNFSKLLENRAEYTFLLTDFTSKYNDIDGNALDGVIISGGTSNFVPRTDYGDIFLYSVPVLYVITTIQRIREMKTIDDYIL